MAFLEEYTLLDELGQGGYATVYKVRHNKLGYIRAIRVLNAVIARGEQDETYQRFLEECRLLLRLGNGSHSNIVHIYQPLLKEQRAIVEMDYVDGQDLYHYLDTQNKFVEIDDVLKLLVNISSALAYCHEDIYNFCMDKEEDNLQDDPEDGRKVLMDEETRQRLIEKYRVIHNDIHSGNIIRRRDGSYVLLDFGLAIEGNSVIRSSKRRNGAPEFKAPEKWDNDGTLTTQSDIYSFGIVLYEFLAGRVPFVFDKENHNLVEAEYMLGKAHKNQQPDSILALREEAFVRAHPDEIYVQDYPDWLETLILKCLAKSPKDRFANGKELFEFVQTNMCSETEELRSLRKLKVEQENNVLTLQGAIDGLKNEIEGLNAEKIALQKDKLELLNRNTQLENEINARDTDFSRLQRANEELGGSVKERQTEISKLQNANGELEDRIKTLHAETVQLKQANVDLHKAYEALTQQANQSGSNDKEVLQLRNENLSLKRELVNLRGNVEKMKSQKNTITTSAGKGWKIATFVLLFILIGIVGYFYGLLSHKNIDIF